MEVSAELKANEISSLNQILNKMEILLQLDKPIETLEELMALDNTFNDYFQENKVVEKWSNIYDIELAFARLSIPPRTASKNNLADMLSSSLVYTQQDTLKYKVKLNDEDLTVNTSFLLQKHQTALQTINEVLEKLSSFLSGVINITEYYQIAILNIKKYNYFGLQPDYYQKVLKAFKYDTTSQAIKPETMYSIYTGGRVINKDYKIQGYVGVINSCTQDCFEYRIHRIVCMLMRLGKPSLVSVLCRLVLSQIEINNMRI